MFPFSGHRPTRTFVQKCRLNDCFEQLKPPLEVTTLPRELTSIYGELRPSLLTRFFFNSMSCVQSKLEGRPKHRGALFVKNFKGLMTNDCLFYVRVLILTVPQEFRF